MDDDEDGGPAGQANQDELCWPKPEALDGGWTAPPLKRLSRGTNGSPLAEGTAVVSVSQLTYRPMRQETHESLAGQ